MAKARQNRWNVATEPGVPTRWERAGGMAKLIVQDNPLETVSSMRFVWEIWFNNKMFHRGYNGNRKSAMRKATSHACYILGSTLIDLAGKANLDYWTHQ
jgi:hypothetical protein